MADRLPRNIGICDRRIEPTSLLENAILLVVSDTEDSEWHLRGRMAKLSKSVDVHLGRQSRLVIPVALRQVLGFEEGDTLVACEEAGRYS